MNHHLVLLSLSSLKWHCTALHLLSVYSFRKHSVSQTHPCGCCGWSGSFALLHGIGVTVYWFVLLWWTCRLFAEWLLKSVFWGTFLAIARSSREGTQEVKTVLGGIESRMEHAQAWVECRPPADLVLEEGNTEDLMSLPDLRCTMSHLSSSAAKVNVSGLGTRAEPSPLPTLRRQKHRWWRHPPTLLGSFGVIKSEDP